MAPRKTQPTTGSAPFFNPPPGTVHVVDLSHSKLYEKYILSDHVCGMLIWAIFMSYATTTRICDNFRTAFASRRVFHHKPGKGHPFLGPDGLALSHEGITLCGSTNVAASPLSHQNILDHPKFDEWLKYVLFQGKEFEDSLLYTLFLTGRTFKVHPVPVLDVPATFVFQTIAPSPLSDELKRVYKWGFTWANTNQTDRADFLLRFPKTALNPVHLAVLDAEDIANNRVAVAVREKGSPTKKRKRGE